MRTSLALGGATSISSITKGLLGSQATAALHLMTCSTVMQHELSHTGCCLFAIRIYGSLRTPLKHCTHALLSITVYEILLPSVIYFKVNTHLEATSRFICHHANDHHCLHYQGIWHIRWICFITLHYKSINLSDTVAPEKANVTWHQTVKSPHNYLAVFWYKHNNSVFGEVSLSETAVNTLGK